MTSSLSSADDKARKISCPVAYDSISESTINNGTKINNDRVDFSPRKWLIAPAIFFYFGAYLVAYSTFGQYVYARVKDENFPNASTSNISTCSSDKNDPNYIAQVKLQEQSSNWMIMFALVSGIPAVFSNGILGCYTDRLGRKFLFILPCIGTFIRILVTSVGVYTNFPLAYFAAGLFIEGLTGSMFTILLVSFTYIADSTPPGKIRSFGIVMIELAIGISMTGFGFGTGYFIQDAGFLYPMLTSLGMSAIAFLVVISMPESFPKEKRRKTASVKDTIKAAYDIFFSIRNKGRRWKFNILMVIFFMTMFTAFGRSGVETLYQLDSPFCWDPEKLGWYLAMRSGLQQVVGMGMIKILQRFTTDEWIAFWGCFSFIAGFTIEGLARNDTMLYVVPVVGSCGLLTIPMVRGIMSKMTPPDKQGAMFASISAIEALCNLVSGVASNAIYSSTVGFFGGFVFLVFVLFNVCSSICMGVYIYGSRGYKTRYQAID